MIGKASLALVAGAPVLAPAPRVSEARIRIAKALPFVDLYRQVAGPRWVDRHAQARAESRLNPRARAVDGGMGLGQFMPQTWVQWGNGGDPFDPMANASAQHRYMLYLEGRTGEYHAALGSYNAGIGSIRKAQRLAAAIGINGPDAWLQALPRVTGINRFTGKPNADITRDYIARNDQFRAELHAAFPGE